MRLRSLVALAPVALFAVGCSVDSDVPDQLDMPGNDDLFIHNDENATKLAADLGLEKVAQRPELILGVGDLSVKRVHIDERGEAHDRIVQTIDGVPVFGAEAIVNLDRRGEIKNVVDKFARNMRVDTKASISQDDARKLAFAAVEGVIEKEIKADLQIMPRPQLGAALTHRFQFEGTNNDGDPAMPVVFIDAHSGEVVMSFDNLKTGRNRNTYNGNTLSSLPGTLVRNEASANSGDAVLDGAHNNIGITYDYFFSKHGRDSYNGLGAELRSTVHHQKNYVNAFWNGTQMVYGDGDGVQSGPLIVLDVAAHELTHAVTDTSSDLIYSNESGALNEAMSDVFGAAVEAFRDGAVSGNTWKIGEECWTPATAGDALRYMNDPAIAGDYDYYPTRYVGTSDNGGVHWNSGIANLAFQLAVVGGSHPRGKSSTVVSPLSSNSLTSIEMGAAIFYRANTTCLTPSSTFADARSCTVAAANTLYGASAATAIGNAWTAVGVAAAPSWNVIDTKSNISGARRSKTYYTYATPAGAGKIKFETSGGSGDIDLYVKWGSTPTTSSYDCRPYAAGNAEACTFDPAKAGSYYVMVYGYQAFSGATFKASTAQ